MASFQDKFESFSVTVRRSDTREVPLSSHAKLFFNPGHDSPERAARDLASALNMDCNTDRGIQVVYKGSYSADWPVAVSGDIRRNNYVFDEPGEETAFDEQPVAWSLRAVPREDEATERRLALQLLRDLARSRPNWSQVLTYEFDELDATYDPARGLRIFPPGTVSDADGRHLWA